MAQPTWTYLRLVNRVLRNMRKPKITDVRSLTLPTVANDVLDVVREEYQEICSRQDWTWLRKTAYLRLNAEVTGTCNVINNTSLVGTISGWSSAFIGRKIVIDGDDEVYVLQTGSDGTNAIIDRSYRGTTGTAVSYTIYDEDYALPDDFSRFVSVNKFIGAGAVRLVGIQELRRIQFEGQGLVSSAGASSPLYATVIQDSGAHDTTSAPAAPILLVHPWPVDSINLPYDYIKIPTEPKSNDDTFDIPQDDMAVLLHKVMIQMFGFIEEDDKANLAIQMFAEKYREMSGSKDNTDDVLRLQMVNVDRVKFSRAKRGRRGGVDWGTYFDKGFS